MSTEKCGIANKKAARLAFGAPADQSVQRIVRISSVESIEIYISRIRYSAREIADFLFLLVVDFPHSTEDISIIKASTEFLLCMN